MSDNLNPEILDNPECTELGDMADLIVTIHWAEGHRKGTYGPTYLAVAANRILDWRGADYPDEYYLRFSDYDE